MRKALYGKNKKMAIVEGKTIYCKYVFTIYQPEYKIQSC